MNKHIKKQQTFAVYLGGEAHQIADQFCRQHSDFTKAERVYLNTLSVYAVNYYLKSMNVETDLESSDSWNPIMQTFLNGADLLVKDKGKLECCAAFPDDDFVEFSEEVTDRIGYVFVEINGEMNEAKLLGFIEKMKAKKLSLLALLPLNELPEYLEKIRIISVLKLKE